MVGAALGADRVTVAVCVGGGSRVVVAVSVIVDVRVAKSVGLFT
jgi:hypothetical protein